MGMKFTMGGAIPPLPPPPSGNVLNHGQLTTITTDSLSPTLNNGHQTWELGAAGVGNVDHSVWAFPRPIDNPAPFNLALQQSPFTTPTGPVISVPNATRNKYMLSACAYTDANGSDSRLILMSKQYTSPNIPWGSVWDYWMRYNDDWMFATPQVPPTPLTDNNMKYFVFTQNGNGPIGTAPFWIWESNGNAGGLHNNTNPTYEGVLETVPSSAGGGMILPDINGHGAFWNTPCVNPAQGNWVHRQCAIKFTRRNDGFLRWWENGNLCCDYLGPTLYNDALPGSVNESHGLNYTRDYGSTAGGSPFPAPTPSQFHHTWNIMYFQGVNTFRIIIADQPIWANVTKFVTQVPASINLGSIPQTYTFTANCGDFPNGSTVYCYGTDDFVAGSNPTLIAGGQAFTVNS